MKRFWLNAVALALQFGKRGLWITGNGIDLEVRDSSNTTLANLKTANPIEDSHVATKAYVDGKAKFVAVGQLNAGTPSPAEPANEAIYICTATGGGYTVNHLYKYDAVGMTWIPISLYDGISFVASDAFSGGTIEFKEARLYIYNLDDDTWYDSGTTDFSGTMKMKIIDFSFGDIGFPKASGKTIPAGATIESITVKVSGAFDQADTTVTVGNLADPDYYMTGDQSSIDEPGGLFQVEKFEDIAIEEEIYYEVAGTSTSGSGRIYVKYRMP